MLELRQQLAEARGRLRSAKDAHDLARAEAEQRAIDGGCSGKNAEERARSLLLALNKDNAYLPSLAALRHAENEVDRLEAELEGARDARRHDEWQIRARLADALERHGVQSDEPTGTGDVFDDTTDHALYADVERHLARQEQPDEEFEMPF